MILLSLPFLLVAPVSMPPVFAQSQRKAVILSSLEGLAPMGFYSTLISNDLKQAGYQVTDLNGAAVTVDFMVTQLNNYDVIIWRTNTYTFEHTTYWYVGERVNSATQQKYATDFANGWINQNAGILGVDVGFFSNHFPTGSLSNVKLILLISSDSYSIGEFLLNAGARAAVVCTDVITLTFGVIDDFTGQLVSYLTHGDSVYDSVYNVVNPFGNPPKDYLDTAYTPPFSFEGDATLTIT
jgi:hypothetical protein